MGSQSVTLWDGINNSQLGSQFSNNYNPAAAQSAQNQITFQQQLAAQHAAAGNKTAIPKNYIASQGSGSSSSSGGAGMNDLIKTIQNMNPQSTSTTTTNQNRSPEMEQQMQQWANMLNTQQANTTQASQGLSNTFADAMNALSQMYGKQSSAAQQGAASGALSSGLTPLEASGAAQTAGQDSLAQFFPQLAALMQGQGQVGVDLQKTLAGNQQALGLPVLGMANQYNQAVAGTTQTGTTTDPMAKLKLLADATAEQQRLAQSQWTQQQNNALGYAELQAQQQYQQGTLANQLKEIMQSGAYQQGTLSNQARGQDMAAQQALQDLQGRMGMSNQSNQTTMRGQDVMSQGQQLTAQAEAAKLQQALQAMLLGQGNIDRTYKTEQERWLAEKQKTGPLYNANKLKAATDALNAVGAENAGGDNPYLTSFFNNMAK